MTREVSVRAGSIREGDEMRNGTVERVRDMKDGTVLIGFRASATILRLSEDASVTVLVKEWVA